MEDRTAARLKRFVLCAALAAMLVIAAPAQTTTTQLLHQALDLAQHGDARQALVLTNQLLEAHPAFVPALKLQGMLLEDAGRLDEAAQSYRKAFQLAPNDSDLLFKVAVRELVAGDKAQAVQLLQHHLLLEPKDGDALYYLAQAYHLTGHDEQALKTIQKCLKIEPDNSSVWQKYGELLCSSGDNEAGIGWLRKAQNVDPRLERIDLDLGIASLNLMDLQSAESYAEKAVLLHPNDVTAQDLLASVKVKLAEWQEASAAYEQVLALKANEADALLGLGRCELELRHYLNAIDRLNQLLQIDPSRVLGHYYLSRAYAGVGNAAEAQHQAELHHKMMEQATFAESALGTVEDKAVWGQARQLLTEHREDAALKLFKENAKGVTATPGHPYFLVGALYLYLGDTENGLRNLHRALEVDPKVRGAHTYLGIYELQQGKLDEAEKEFRAEIGNDPNYQTAVAELGVVRYRQQRWAEAAEQLSKSHTKIPNLLLMLCDAEFHLGKVADANITAEIVAAYAKDNQELMESLIDLLTRNGQTEEIQRLTESGKKQ